MKKDKIIIISILLIIIAIITFFVILSLYDRKPISYVSA